MFFGRFKYTQLIELRDLAIDTINCDTLYILCKEENINKLEKLWFKWEVNEYGYYVAQNGKICHEGTIDFRSNELLSAYGDNLEDGNALIRLWWD